MSNALDGCCYECVFFARRGEDNAHVGDCRRFPPIVVSRHGESFNSIFNAAYPVVSDLWKCGEFKGLRP